MEKVIEDQLGFRKGKGTRDAIAMLRNIEERGLALKEEVHIYFINWQKVFN